MFNWLRKNKPISQEIEKGKYDEAEGYVLTDHNPYEEKAGKQNDVDYNDYVDVYEASVWAYACIRVIMQSAASLPIIVYHKESEEKGDGKSTWIPEEDNDIYRLLNYPNPDMTGADLIEGTMCYLECTGNGYWEITRASDNPKAEPRELYLLKSQCMKPVPGAKKLVTGYVYTVNSRSQTFNPEEIMQFKYFNPKSEWYGFGPIQAAVSAFTMDFYAIGYNKDFFKNHAMPDGVLTTERKLTDATYERLKAWWSKRHKGQGRRHETEILPEGIDYKEIAKTPKDIEFVNQRKLSREEITSAFGVPPIELGLLEYASYSNAKQQEQIFWEKTMKPKMGKLARKITNNLIIPFWGDDYKVEFDFSGIEALQESEADKSKKLQDFVDKGIMSRNEARKELNLPEIVGGDVIYINPMLVPLDGEEIQDTGGKEETEKSLGRLDNKSKELVGSLYGKEGDNGDSLRT